MEAQLVTALGDGVGPAVLLTLGQRLKGQYLFNVPEGFSRFVLEHKVRPTNNLRAVFAMDLQSLAGFGGLVMRLRNEGHGQVHVLGPPGTQAMVTSLRHFIHWKHPAVLLSELSEWEMPVCYEDEHIVVAALWKPALVPELWPAPGWVLGPVQSTQPRGRQLISSSSSSEEGSSSSSDESDGSSSGVDEVGIPSTRGSLGSGSSKGAACGGSATGAASREQHPQRRAAPVAATEQPAGPQAVGSAGGSAAAAGGKPAPSLLSMFDELDQIFMRGGGRAGTGQGPARVSRTRISVLERLKAGSQGGPLPQSAPTPAAAAAAASATGAVAAPGATQGAGVGAAAAAGRGEASVGNTGPAAATGSERMAVASMAAAAAAAAPRRRVQLAICPAAGHAPAAAQPSSAAPAGNASAGRVYVVGGKPYREVLGAPGINSWIHDKLSSKRRAQGSAGPAANGSSSSTSRVAVGAGMRATPGTGAGAGGGRAAAGRTGGPEGAASQHLLGYLCHVKASDQLLLVASLRGRGAVRQLQEHPALAHLRQQSSRLAGAILLAEPGLSRLPQFKRLLAGLPGEHILLERPGPTNQDIGHLAAARTTAKLHLVAPSIFPLPAAFAALQPRAKAPSLSAPAGSADGAGAGQHAVHLQAIESQGWRGQLDSDGGGEGLAQTVVDNEVDDATAEASAQQPGAGMEVATAAGDVQEKGGGGSPGEDAGEQPVPAGAASAAGGAGRGQRQLAAGLRLRHVRSLSRALWGPGPHATGPAAASQPATSAQPASVPSLALLWVEPAEAFGAEAAAGRGAEGRPSGVNPSAVWRELREGKHELPAKLGELAEVVATIGKLPAQPRTLPLPNRVQPGQQPPPQQQQLAGAPASAPPQHTQQQQWPQHAAPPPRPPTVAPMAGPPNSAVPLLLHPPPLHGPQQQAGQCWAPAPPPMYAQPPPAPPGMMWVLHPALAYTSNGLPPPQQRLPYPPHYHQPLAPGPAGYGLPPMQAPPPLHGALGFAAPGSIPPSPRPPAPPVAPPPSGPGAEPASHGAAATVNGVLGKRPSPPQHEQQGAGEQLSNKRAAADLRARLKQRPPVPEVPQAGLSPERASPAAAVPSPGSAGSEAQQPSQQQQQQGNDMEEGAQQARQQQRQQSQGRDAACPGSVEELWGSGSWAKGAPPCLRALAEAGDGSQVVFLGTGSAEPSKYRGASAIHLRLDCGQGLLLDCGEGCLGQMERLYGYRAARQQVAALGCVWISHRHADHLLGLLGILAAYPPHLPPLLVVGPYTARDWLAEAGPHLRLRYVFAHCTELNTPGHWVRRQLAERLGVEQLESVGVRHCSDAYGVVVVHRSGWRLVYSGDTQPCNSLMQAGRGCTLLIHEATFEPCLADQAARKRHSTTAEALAVAQAMGAYRTILTHFSQRYPKFPEGLPAEGPAAASTAIAFDGMCVPLAALPLLPSLRPAVEYVLASEEEGEEQGEQAAAAAATAGAGAGSAKAMAAAAAAAAAGT